MLGTATSHGQPGESMGQVGGCCPSGLWDGQSAPWGLVVATREGGPSLRTLLPEWAKGPLTLLLLLLFLLLQLALLDAAELGLADAPSLADGLQQSGPATGGVHHFLGSSLDCSWEGQGVRKRASQAGQPEGQPCPAQGSGGPEAFPQVWL